MDLGEPRIITDGPREMALDRYAELVCGLDGHLFMAMDDNLPRGMQRVILEGFLAACRSALEIFDEGRI